MAFSWRTGHDSPWELWGSLLLDRPLFFCKDRYGSHQTININQPFLDWFPIESTDFPRCCSTVGGFIAPQKQDPTVIPSEELEAMEQCIGSLSCSATISVIPSNEIQLQFFFERFRTTTKHINSGQI